MDADRRSWIVLFLLALFVGCAAPEKYVLGIDVPSAQNPGQGPPVVLTDVVDTREFQGPTTPRSQRYLHQLATGGLGERDVEARIYAQMRRTDGSVVYDFMLPEGESVRNVVRLALESGFRRAGYRIVGPSSPEAAGAPRVRAEVERFWAWNSGNQQTFFSFESKVKLLGDVSLRTADGRSQVDVIESSVSLDTMFMARPQGFVNTTSKGIEQFMENLQIALGR